MLIDYTVEQANICFNKNIINDYVISTDDEVIIEKYREKCQERPFGLAQGEPGSIINVLNYVISTYENKFNKKIDAILLLQPTSPLRIIDDIEMSVDMFRRSNAGKKVEIQINKTFGEFTWYFNPYTDSLISVSEATAMKRYYDFEFNPLTEQKSTHDKHRDRFLWQRNGAIFITRRDLIDKDKIFSEKPICYIMPKYRSIDIDDMEDMFIAESILKNKGEIQ